MLHLDKGNKIFDNKLVSLCLKKEDNDQISRITDLAGEYQIEVVAGERFYIKFYVTESYVFVDIMRKY